jgi:hypothetical protein
MEGFKRKVTDNIGSKLNNLNILVSYLHQHEDISPSYYEKKYVL